MLNWNPSRLPRVASLTLLLLSGAALPALALDSDDFATKLNAAYTAQGGEITFMAIEAYGSDITLKQTKIIAPGQPGMEMGDLTFEDVSETGDGGYLAGLLKIADVDHTKDETRIQIVDLELRGLKIPADPSVKGIDSILFYDGFSTGPITISKKGSEFFKLAGTNAKASKMTGGKGFEIAFAANGIAVDVKGIGDHKEQKTLNELGYEKLNGSMIAEGFWELESGRIHLPIFALTFDDVGKLNFAMDVSGYTMEYIKAMGDAQKAAAKNPDKDAAQKASGMMMLGMMQQLTLNTAEINFADASLTGRLLEFAGKKQGVSGAQMAQAAKGMLPLVVGQLGIPALQAQIVAAANVYLENPKNLSVSARPAAPVPFAQIMGAGMTDPRQLADLLNVQITANE